MFSLVSREIWGNLAFSMLFEKMGATIHYVIANEPAERRRSACEAAENSAARRMAYAIEL